MTVVDPTLDALVLSADTPAARTAWGLDVALFTHPVITIDERNDKVASARSLAAARDAVRRGQGVTWAATLRPGVAAIDVDLDDEDTALLVVADLVDWCSTHSVWSCARLSGGGPGRWHVIAVAAELSDSLYALVAELRTRHNLTSRELDWRSILRPLSAPHRQTGRVTLPGDVDALARDLRESHRQPGSTVQSKLTNDTSPTAPLAPQQRSPLPADFWTKIRRAHPIGTDRSTVEFWHTVTMVKAGWTEDDAWTTIADPAHKGLVRSRVRGRAWWTRQVWNRVWRDQSASRPINRPTIWQGTYRWDTVLATARGVRQVWDQWPTRRRHSIDQVAAVAADRVIRARLSPVPLSIRSVVEDTGLDKNTVASALHELTRTNVLVRVETYSYATDDGSGTSSSVYTTNLLSMDFRSPTHTPSSYTPPPASPHWLNLPPGSLSTWLDLSLSGEPTPTSASHRSRALLTARLEALHSRSLIRRTSAGWSVSGRKQYSAPRKALEKWSRMRRQHQLERAEFRELRGIERSSREGRWCDAREKARDRQAVHDVRRHAQWFTSLGADERRARKALWTASWEALEPGARALRKERLRDRRARALRGSLWATMVPA